MVENEERLTERSVSEREPAVNTISELPGKKYGITVEVPMFLAMLGISLSGTAISNIILYRTCVHSLHHDKAECQVFLGPDKSNSSRQLEEEVQKYVTFISTVKIVLESVGPAILSFFLGVWSDTHGRKPLIVWPLLGMALTSMMVVVYSMLEDYGPWWYVLTAIPYSLTGGFTVLFTGTFCYLTDITSTKNRSLRMTILEAMVSVGSVVGGIASSYLLKAVGNVYLLLIVAVLNVISYAYSNIYLRESLTGAVRGGFTSILDLLLVKEMMRQCFKRRPNYGRAQILLLTVANSLSIFILYGIVGLDYLYAREKLHWAMKEYTIFSAASTTISFFGSFLGVGLVQKILPVGDLMFSIIAFLSSAVEYFIRTFATLTWHMYLGAGVSLFKGLSAPLIRSLITKILPVEDIAKVFSLMCALEGISPLFSPAIYNTLYNFTISRFPGAVYMLSGAICIVCAVMLAFVKFYRWRAARPAYSPLQE
ncbi:solute carrier family 46 member 3-like [Pectinophora gossypiella]|uniref:solute carrier family 46 member 3-like n=1 Tax=Pectinophora gossypiella TaxID=13191 RepID=UPI00214ED927|nr:solute carrier family 46 member 3-like [Pectinophora gossypiella]